MNAALPNADVVPGASAAAAAAFAELPPDRTPAEGFPSVAPIFPPIAARVAARRMLAFPFPRERRRSDVSRSMPVTSIGSGTVEPAQRSARIRSRLARRDRRERPRRRRARPSAARAVLGRTTLRRTTLRRVHPRRLSAARLDGVVFATFGGERRAHSGSLRRFRGTRLSGCRAAAARAARSRRL